MQDHQRQTPCRYGPEVPVKCRVLSQMGDARTGMKKPRTAGRVARSVYLKSGRGIAPIPRQAGCWRTLVVATPLVGAFVWCDWGPIRKQNVFLGFWAALIRLPLAASFPVRRRHDRGRKRCAGKRLACKHANPLESGWRRPPRSGLSTGGNWAIGVHAVPSVCLPRTSAVI